MEWVSQLYGKTVALDTAPLIYFIEENPTYQKLIHPFFESMDGGDFTVVTSTLTLLEVLVHPLRKGNHDLAAEYKEILLNSKLITMEISSTIAEQAARLRAVHNIRTPDAIQIGSALNAGASHFITNDIRLPQIPGIQIFTLDGIINRL
ncbi:MAG: type II toxin-antitoxin system VapC family toxin [Desulfobacteraceae bacterium]|nr:MAG: type II toxin-antitoxin system VapC family toxin [Desulfobacteraceae bacterium]